MSNALTLSEAIRLGSLLHPQGFERMRCATRFELGLDGVLRPMNIRTCALGAAAEAMGLKPDGIEQALRDRFPQHSYHHRGADIGCPDPSCGKHYTDVFVMVMHLNDTHHWTRERIANFIETEEHRIASAAPALSLCNSAL